MALEKLVITPLGKNGGRLEQKAVKVMFNPSDYSISKSVNWESGSTDRRFNAPGIIFKGGGSRKLSLKLFYDVTEPVNGVKYADVRELTNKLILFTRMDRDLQRPPTVQVSWGKAPVGSDFPFTGVITSLSQQFVLFSGKGKPLRANVDIDLLEYIKPEMDKRETDPELTTYRIKRGDTLANITATLYDDVSDWRRIAEANGLDNPRILEIGKLLTIPESE
ncbi:peptidoglycan-binding protein [Nitrosomonas sp. PY1]|uniref:CIS tube protein n=1 Tax=Nitrosomonas sp. PY1 TaxID=1803906 RepID=UPI001FC84356|nr:LysM peptidoglycan-binding domain-containing protein [Nitrosomonas sp. PY1]GKS69038.1 peptidoglycan-binding protein [Nitrosomonas sp. PY1]